MFDRIMPQIWMLLSPAERQVLIEAFNLNKSGIIEIRDQDVMTDGYTLEDLAHITPEKMAEYVGYDENDEIPAFHRLWELSVAKARSIVNPPIAVITSTDGVGSLEEVPAPVVADPTPAPESAPVETPPKTRKNAKTTEANAAE